MEPFSAFLLAIAVASYAVREGGNDLLATAQGREPPSMHRWRERQRRREARGFAREHQPGPLRRIWRAGAQDWADAAEHRTARRVARRAAQAEGHGPQAEQAAQQHARRRTDRFYRMVRRFRVAAQLAHDAGDWIRHVRQRRRAHGLGDDEPGQSQPTTDSAAGDSRSQSTTGLAAGDSRSTAPPGVDADEQPATRWGEAQRTDRDPDSDPAGEPDSTIEDAEVVVPDTPAALTAAATDTTTEDTTMTAPEQTATTAPAEISEITSLEGWVAFNDAAHEWTHALTGRLEEQQGAMNTLASDVQNMLAALEAAMASLRHKGMRDDTTHMQAYAAMHEHLEVMLTTAEQSQTALGQLHEATGSVQNATQQAEQAAQQHVGVQETVQGAEAAGAGRADTDFY